MTKVFPPSISKRSRLRRCWGASLPEENNSSSLLGSAAWGRLGQKARRGASTETHQDPGHGESTFGLDPAWPFTEHP